MKYDLRSPDMNHSITERIGKFTIIAENVSEQKALVQLAAAVMQTVKAFTVPKKSVKEIAREHGIALAEQDPVKLS